MTLAKLVKLGRKGQMVLPKVIRDALGLKEGDPVVVVFQGEEAILTTPERYAALTKGMCRGTWGQTKEAIGQYLEEERRSWVGKPG